MELYIGTKAINAKPMTLGEYNAYRSWEMPANQDPDDPGYLVEYLDGGARNHASHNGYISWSPADVFEAAYQKNAAMNFSHALWALKSGLRVSRLGWNGKGMWIALTPGSSFPAGLAKDGHAAKFRADELGGADTVELLPHIDMRAADGSMVIGWLASQTDMLAEDWCIVAD